MFESPFADNIKEIFVYYTDAEYSGFFVLLSVTVFLLGIHYCELIVPLSLNIFK